MIFSASLGQMIGLHHIQFNGQNAQRQHQLIDHISKRIQLYLVNEYQGSLHADE